MPLFEYECGQGHRRELVRPANATVACPDCGAPADRRPVFGATLRHPEPKYRLSLVQEAAQEAAYYHERMEQHVGHELPRRNLFAAGMNRARRQQ